MMDAGSSFFHMAERCGGTLPARPLSEAAAALLFHAMPA
jgi:hypothetical protein